ncbi:MAG TPA: hypothetical protein VEV37_13215, partial [Bryobacteraceae bacterium]|nr:hypothetical protein [Bryobacteraceae bacterium]
MKSHVAHALVGAASTLVSTLVLASALNAATFYVTIAGLGGEPDFEQRFTSLAQEIDKLVQSNSDSKVTTLYGPKATKAQIQAALGQIAKEAKPADALVVMMIGHGGYDGFEYKINLPGPDLSGVELASLLDRIPATRQLVVNMTSASGGSRAALEKQGRVVITATKSGTEKNATVFARYWVEALRDPAADTDKNETVTALEAFNYANEKTAQFYESQKRLATEHPTLEDTGQGDGARKPSPENGQGLLASRFTLLRLGSTQLAATTPEKKALLEKREELEQAIDKLKY